MSNLAIRVDNLSKQYKIGIGPRHDTLKDFLAYSVNALFRRNWDFPIRNSKSDYLWALQDVSFEVKRGETLGIIGANGAGKSTLLKILSRITEPTSGRAELFGRVGSLLEVGTGFDRELTGRENIYLNGAILGMKKAEITGKFDEIVAFAEVDRFVDTPVKHYSSGMYVRLAFAVAAHLEPEILIVDEVLAVGDIGFQRKCLGKMQDVATSGRTVLFVSHNMGAIKSLCSRSFLLMDGGIRVEGPSARVVEQYVVESQEQIGTQRVEWIEADRDRGEGFLLYRGKNGGDIIIRCGAPITIEFNVEAPKPLAEATVGITILNPLGDPIASMSSKVQNVPSVPGCSRLWTIQCEMGCLPINTGTYSARVYLGNGVHDVARFSNAFTIRVIEHDVFGWGNSLPSSDDWGPIYWAPQWDIRPVG